jgi:SAM-dependent methyltransferase
MKIRVLEPPREFQVGRGAPITIRDCGRVELQADEQITLVTESGGEYDVARKSWGFYATPSLNARLKRFGFRPALVRSGDDKWYVFLLEGGGEAEFARYLRLEGHLVVAWLDDPETLRALEAGLGGSAAVPPGAPTCLCPIAQLSVVHVFEQPPAGEIPFAAIQGQPYRRQLLRCGRCGHFVSWHSLHDGSLYTGDYVTANYADEAGIRRTFDRINNLPPEQSDNVARVRRIQEFAAGHFAAERPRPWSVLDVGSGLGVFPHRMKQAGWACTALDPDPRSARHARETVGVQAVCGSFGEVDDLGTFDLITFNKVLEHVREPATLLARSGQHLAPGGFVYVELPDGEAAFADSPAREEFFIDHFHVFSLTSLAQLASRAGLQVRAIERLREPSGKYTLRAFLAPLAQRRS